MPDKQYDGTSDVSSNPRTMFEIVPDDGADLSHNIRAINLATDGSVRIDAVGGGTVTLFLAAGIWHPCRAKRVYATGTTVTGLVGGY